MAAVACTQPLIQENRRRSTYACSSTNSWGLTNRLQTIALMVAYSHMHRYGLYVLWIENEACLCKANLAHKEYCSGKVESQAQVQMGLQWISHSYPDIMEEKAADST